MSDRSAVRSSARLSGDSTAAPAVEPRSAPHASQGRGRPVSTTAAAALRRARAAERAAEVEDSPRVLRDKCRRLARALRNAKHLVVYTGAGISTAADIPDYRGPHGVWTRLQRGETVGDLHVTLCRLVQAARMMGLRRAWWAAWRRWRALALAAALLCALSVRVPAELASAHHFPAHSPADLAHSLADFSNQPHVDSWSVEEDRSNYTTWRYTVSFSCGARCTGHAAVLAHDEPLAAPRHGHAAREHRVSVARRSCTNLPLIPWPQFCEELEINAVVKGSSGGGALLHEVSHTRCSALAWLSGACARWLRAQQDFRIMRLRALQDVPQPA